MQPVSVQRKQGVGSVGLGGHVGGLGIGVDGQRPAAAGGQPFRTDLGTTRRYRVIMAKLEWDTRFRRLAEKVRERTPTNPLAACRAEPMASPVTFTDALGTYLRRLTSDGGTALGRAGKLIERRSF